MDRTPRLVVVGQVARDLVLQVARLPGPGAAVDVERRLEMLGGKGANQGVALAQLGASVALVGVVGDDQAGRRVLDQAARDGLDVAGVTRRAGGTTALLVDVVEADGTRRLLEHVPEEVLLTADDVTAAGERVLATDTVVVQLQQPVPAGLAALGLARRAGRMTVVDGAPEGDAADRERVLGLADVVRADAHEAELLLGRGLRSLDDTVRAVEELLARRSWRSATGRWASGAPCREGVPATTEQRCWSHRSANTLAALPKSAHPGEEDAGGDLQHPGQERAQTAVRAFEAAYGAKFPRTTVRITDGVEVLYLLLPLVRPGRGAPVLEAGKHVLVAVPTPGGTHLPEVRDGLLLQVLPARAQLCLWKSGSLSRSSSRTGRRRGSVARRGSVVDTRRR